MNSTIIGVYDSQQEVIQAIQELQGDGLRVQDLGIIARTTGSDTSIEDKTGANALEFESAGDNGNEDDLVNNLANLYNNVEFDEDSTINRFLELGMSQGQAREYASYVENGKIILYNDNQGLSSGNAHASGYNVTTDSRAGLGLSAGTVHNQDSMDTLWNTEEQEQTLNLREEQLNVTKNQVKAGEVTIHKDIIEEQKNIEVPVTREELYVERRKADGESIADSPIGDGETIRIPLREEKVNVSKQEMVTEELVIGKRQIQDTEKVTESVKKEEVRLEGDRDKVSKSGTINNDDFRKEDGLL